MTAEPLKSSLKVRSNSAPEEQVPTPEGVVVVCGCVVGAAVVGALVVRGPVVGALVTGGVGVLVVGVLVDEVAVVVVTLNVLDVGSVEVNFAVVFVEPVDVADGDDVGPGDLLDVEL